MTAITTAEARMDKPLTKCQAESLHWLAEHTVCRGCGPAMTLHRLQLRGLVTVQWIGYREWAYTITRAGRALAAQLPPVAPVSPQ